MQLRSIIVALGLASGAVAIAGKSFTGWDCCKPGCAWKGNLGKDVKGEPKVCDINNNPITSGGLDAKSGCDKDGKAYLCADYTPQPQASNISYGFAVMFGAEHCCKCYSVTWTSGAATGKTMIVQAITTADKGNLGANDIVIQTPGGGAGDNEQGCRNQYGTNWGKAGGGVDNSAACASLPQNLQGGCYWRFNWAGGPMNGWGINYQQTSCPRELSRISGCSA